MFCSVALGVLLSQEKALRRKQDRKGIFGLDGAPTLCQVLQKRWSRVLYIAFELKSSVTQITRAQVTSSY